MSQLAARAMDSPDRVVLYNGVIAVDTDVRAWRMRNPIRRYVAYYRVSTAKQGRSGLGIEAQREAVVRYVDEGWQVVGEFTEVESGKRVDRPQLEQALGAARLHRCPLVVAKVDRLTRSVSFLSRLLEAM